MRHKQRIQIGRNVTNIIKLPCVRAVEKQADGTLFYLLYGGQIARKGNWLVETLTGKWYVLPDDAFVIEERIKETCIRKGVTLDVHTALFQQNKNIN